MANRYMPAVLVGAIIACFGVRLYMTQMWGWLLFLEIPILLLALLVLIGLSIFLGFKKDNRFPVVVASVLVGFYFFGCLIAGDISDEDGVYYLGSFHESGSSNTITEFFASFSIYFRSFILLALIGVYIYGATGRRKEKLATQHMSITAATE